MIGYPCMCMKHALLCHAVLWDRIAWRKSWINFTLEICNYIVVCTDKLGMRL